MSNTHTESATIDLVKVAPSIWVKPKHVEAWQRVRATMKPNKR